MVSGTFFVTGGYHVRRFSRFRRDLRAQEIFRRQLGLVAVGISAFEILIATGSIAFLLAQPRVFRVLMLAAGMFLVLASLYSLALRRRSPDVPCACGPADRAAGGWAALRALVLAGFAFLAALRPPVLSALPQSEALLALVTGGVLGVVLWILPAALSSDAVDSPHQRVGV